MFFEDPVMAATHHDSPSDLPLKRKWPRRLAILLAGLIILVYCLPYLLLLGPVRQRLIDWAMADVHGQVKMESLSTGWFSPIRIRGLELQDDNGQVVLSIPQITTSKRLIDFLRSDAAAPASGLFLRFRSRADQQRLVQVAPRRV